MFYLKTFRINTYLLYLGLHFRFLFYQILRSRIIDILGLNVRILIKDLSKSNSLIGNTRAIHLVAACSPYKLSFCSLEFVIIMSCRITQNVFD